MTTPRKNPAAVALGRLGGRAGTGAAKARSSEQARAAAIKRWEKHAPANFFSDSPRSVFRSAETYAKTGDTKNKR